MRIGLDALPLVPPKTGIGHYTFELARALAEIAPSYDLELIMPFALPLAVEPEDGGQMPPNLRVVRAGAKGLSKRWWVVGLPLYASRNALSLFHGTNYNVPLWARCPTVNTIHDLSLLLHPETHEAKAVARARRKLPLMARAATMIVTDTQSVKRELCERLRVAPDKVAAVHIAPRRVFHPMPAGECRGVTRRLGVVDDFILYVGTVEPRKNLVTLVRAFDELLRHTALRPQLVIAGKMGWLTDELFSSINRAGLADRIVFTGYVADADLRALYSACKVCVYPSLYEGFGLPPLEAMACGAPVIASDIPSLLETVGPAAHMFCPTDHTALARRIVELLEDPNQRQRLSEAGLRHAGKFSWEATARATLEVYREAAERKKTRFL